MTKRFVAFLRAINVGGRVVPMAELRRHFEALGLDDVETFIASGNVIFSSHTKSLPALAKRIESGLRTELGYDVPVFVRSVDEVAAIAKQQPFTAAQFREFRTFVVGMLAEPLSAAAAKSLLALQTDDDRFHIDRREIYWLTRHGQSDSLISNVVLEKALKVRSTLRGMNTMKRLVEKFGF